MEDYRAFRSLLFNDPHGGGQARQIAKQQRPVPIGRRTVAGARLVEADRVARLCLPCPIRADTIRVQDEVDEKLVPLGIPAADRIVASLLLPIRNRGKGKPDELVRDIGRLEGCEISPAERQALHRAAEAFA